MTLRGFRVCSFCRKKERTCHFARGGRVGWTGRFWELRKLAGSVARNGSWSDPREGARAIFACISYRIPENNQVPKLPRSLGWRCRMTNDQEKEVQLRASRQRAATRNPTQVVSSAYLQKPTRNIQGPLLSRSLGWRCRMTNDQKKSCSFVPPSSTEPRGTRPRWFQVHIYKKPDPEHSGPYIFQGRWGGVAGWQTARVDKGTVLRLQQH